MSTSEGGRPPPPNNNNDPNFILKPGQGPKPGDLSLKARLNLKTAIPIPKPTILEAKINTNGTKPNQSNNTNPIRNRVDNTNQLPKKNPDERVEEVPKLVVTPHAIPTKRILREGWINSYMKYAEEQESPKEFHLWSSFAILAAALRRNVFVDQAFFKVYPNLYVCLVAISAECRKTVASSLGVKMLAKVPGMTIFREKGSSEGMIEYMNNIPQHKVGSRIVSDSSMLIYAPELSVFFSSANYSSDLSMILTTLYDCPETFPFNTKHNPTVVINPAPTILAASTPGMLGKILSIATTEGGFSGRWLFCVQTEKGKLNPRPKKTPEWLQLESDLIHDLEYISNIHGEFTFSDAGGKWYDDWYKYKQNIPESDPRLMGYYQRKATTVLKIAMIISLSKSDKLVLEVEDIKTAISCLAKLEEKLSLAFQYVGSANSAVGEEALVMIYKAGGILGFSELAKVFIPKTRNIQELKDVLHALVEAGLLAGPRIGPDKMKYFYLRSVSDAEFNMKFVQESGQRSTQSGVAGVEKRKERQI